MSLSKKSREEEFLLSFGVDESTQRTKVANPQDILRFSKASKRSQIEAKIDDSDELYQQGKFPKLEVLSFNDLDVAMHNFVNKGDNLAFYNYLQYTLEETYNKIRKNADDLISKFHVEDWKLKLRECLEEVSRKGPHTLRIPFSSHPNVRSKSDTGIGSAVSFSDDEDTEQISSSANRGRKGSLTASQSSRDAPELVKGKTSTRGTGGGRDRGRGSSGLKQTTVDSTLGFGHSQRSASAAVSSIVDDEENINSADEIIRRVMLH